MDPNCAPPPPRLLTLHEDRAFIGNLTAAIQPRIPALAVEHCASPRDAKARLSQSSYHAVVVSPTLTMQGDVSVLTSSRRISPPVPLLMTLKDEERAFAEDWLDLGVYDFILYPFDLCEAFQSVQQALRLSQIRAMILRTEEALFRLQGRREGYRAHHADSSLFNEVHRLLEQSMVRLEKSKDSLEETFISLERTLRQLQHNRRENEFCAKQRATRRLSPDPPL